MEEENFTKLYIVKMPNSFCGIGAMMLNHPKNVDNDVFKTLNFPQFKLCRFLTRPRNTRRAGRLSRRRIRSLSRATFLTRTSFEVTRCGPCDNVSLYIILHPIQFDFRIYVLVTSINPLRIYLYKNGLVRFATEKFSTDPKVLSI